MREPCTSIETRARAQSLRFARLKTFRITFDTPHSQQKSQRSNLPLKVEEGKTYRRAEIVTRHAASLTIIKRKEGNHGESAER